jgi:hypothetical protein
MAGEMRRSIVMLNRRAFTIVSLASLLLCGAWSAQAGSLGGHAWIRGKSIAQGKVAIGQSIYHVTPRTRIRGMEGEPLSLTTLDGVPDFESLTKIPRHPKFWVEFDASEVAGRLELNWMEIKDGPETMPDSYRSSPR